MYRRKKSGRLLRMLSLLICCGVLCSMLTGLSAAALNKRTLTLEQAQQMAVSNSSDITRQKNQITLKRMKYVEAVEGIKAKVKNLRSFRWTPLLSFKFPQQLDLTEEYELNIKPLTLQTEIDNLVHGLEDLRSGAIYEASLLYNEVYILQETIAFTEQRLADARQQLTRNQGGVLTGDAAQADVDRSQSSVDTLTKDLAAQLREFETAKEKLSDLIGINVTTGYKFANGLKTAQIPRDQLDSLIQYTLDHDQSFYETKAATSTARLNMESYEDFMRSEYGSKMDYIQPYIDQARQGMNVDYAAFQLKYKDMLKALDKPWSGKIRILFFKFTMEWFKGEIDGTRYIEDEMYAVYTACMEYGNAKKDQDAAEKALRSQVRDSFESLVTQWNAYLSLQELVETAKQTQERVLALNRMGKATYEETADAQQSYQDAQMDALDALKAYNDMLSEFDRLTCGAAGKYTSKTGMGLDAGEGGDAYAVLDPIEDPYYYIYSTVADLAFSIGISIPDAFKPAIDAFEVWYDGSRIGTRTPLGTELRHLMLDYKDTNKLLIRLYYEDEFVDECEINAAVPRDVLPIAGSAAVDRTRTVGTYQVSTGMQGGVSVSELKLTVNAVEGVSFYTLHHGEQGIYTTERYAVSESFSYLTLLIASLEEVTASLYDDQGVKLMDVRFDTQTQQLVTLPDQA